MTQDLNERLARAAHALFGRFGDLTDEDHRAAVAAFASCPRPYYDEPRQRWLVGQYDQARSVLRDRRLGNDLSSAASETNSQRLHARLSPDAPSLLFIDPPEHDAIKAELARLFTSDALAGITGLLRQRWREVLERMATVPTAGLGGDAVHPICVAAVFAVLGLAQPDPAAVPGIVDDLYQVNLLFDLSASPEQRARSEAANERMRAMVQALLPGSAVAERMRAGGAGDEVILSTVVFMLRAGVVTVGSLLISLLLERLDAAEDAAEGHDEFRALIRHTPTGDTGRVTSEDLTLGDVTIPANSTVLALLSAANHALEARPGPVPGHLVFGSGLHRCVGERLVRLHLDAALEATRHAGCTVQPVRTDPHRTASFRGYREVDVAVCPVTGASGA
jgi:cytochrome P450